MANRLFDFRGLPTEIMEHVMLYFFCTVPYSRIECYLNMFTDDEVVKPVVMSDAFRGRLTTLFVRRFPERTTEFILIDEMTSPFAKIKKVDVSLDNFDYFMRLGCPFPEMPSVETLVALSPNSHKYAEATYERQKFIVTRLLLAFPNIKRLELNVACYTLHQGLMLRNNPPPQPEEEIAAAVLLKLAHIESLVFIHSSDDHPCHIPRWCLDVAERHLKSYPGVLKKFHVTAFILEDDEIETVNRLRGEYPHCLFEYVEIERRQRDRERERALKRLRAV